MIKIFLSSLILFAISSYYTTSLAKTGGNEVGNGGNAIVCNQEERFYLFYDEYESMNRYVLPLKLPEEYGKLEAEALTLKFIERLSRLDHDLASELTLSASTFTKNAIILYGAKLSSVDDTGIWFVPKNCKIKQAIIQKNPMFPNDRRYWIDGDLWNQMPTQSKAIAILHEVLYKKAILINPNISSSEGIRYFVGLLISDEINKISTLDYEKIKNQTGLGRR